MTIAISLKVNDGLVLAADSASSMVGAGPARPIFNVYNNANKVFNLRKSLPIGAITWGAGSMGVASISTLVKDLRRRFSGEDPHHKDWHLDPQAYSVKYVADRFKEFIYDETYVPAFSNWPAPKPDVGFVVAGYSPLAMMAEEYRIVIDQTGTCHGPTLERQNSEAGVSWFGQPEAISRLLFGVSPGLGDVLQKEFGATQPDALAALEKFKGYLGAPLVESAMPFQDAIDLAEFLVDLSIQWSRFMPGAPVVGGPIEVAAISKHEGFKWIKRKHYYSSELNPRT
jgi:hypothetical protein